MRQTQVGFLSFLLFCLDEELRGSFDLLYPCGPAEKKCDEKITLCTLLTYFVNLSHFIVSYFNLKLWTVVYIEIYGVDVCTV